MIEQHVNVLHEALRGISSDAPAQYGHDRDQAFQWYSERGLPLHDLKTEQGATAFDLLAQAAAKSGIWEEAWAGFHHALAGYLLTRPANIPRMCWSLGRAQLGRGNYDLASLYLEAGERLADPAEHVNLIGQLLIEKAVLAIVTKKPDRICSAAYGRVREYFARPSGPGSSVAEAAAISVFNDGKANHQWLDTAGKPIRSSLILATGYYHVSLSMNHDLANDRGLAMTQAQLGDAERKLGDKLMARLHWNTALRLLSKLGDKKSAASVKQWLREL